MKDTWYWSIVKIPLKFHRQPAVVHEPGSECHNGDHNFAQGPLLLEDGNRRLRLLTTREEVSKPLDPYTLSMITLYAIMPFLYLLVNNKGTSTKLLRYKGIVNTRRILIRQEIFWSRICSGLTNLSLNCLILFIPCLLLLTCKIPKQPL